MSEGIEITKNATCNFETDKAIKVSSPDFGGALTPTWFPKSAIHDDSECYKKDTSGTLIVKYWFAEKAGFAEGNGWS